MHFTLNSSAFDHDKITDLAYFTDATQQIRQEMKLLRVGLDIQLTLNKFHV